MTGKSRNWVRIEADIVKGREEGNWKKLIELAEHLKSRSPSSECLAHFLIGEGKLESYLEAFPPVEQNNNKARSGLSEAKRYLLSTVGEQGKQDHKPIHRSSHPELVQMPVKNKTSFRAKVSISQPPLKICGQSMRSLSSGDMNAGFLLLDVFLLLGKTHYAMGHYEEALDYYNQAELQSLTEKHLPSRSLRIVAESYAIKGMCLEKVPPLSSSKYKQAEWDEQRIQCFELAGDLTLRYLQEQDKQQQHSSTPGSYSPQPPNPAKHIGPILETALQRAPILYMQTGKLQSAVSRYRVMLSAIETAATQSLRLTLTRRLAEVLLRGVTGKVYVNPEKDTNIFPKKNKGVVESPWKPRRYIGQHLFVPRTENEEIILLLLISEAMAVRDAVLSQSPEFKDARIHAYKNATAVYDLLTITLVRWDYIDLVYESFERAMKFSFEEPHVWMQKALCLMSMGQYPRALKVLKEVIRLLPTKVLPCLLAARICFEHTNQFAEGLQWSCQALSRESSSPQNLASRCHLYVGIGYSLQAANTTLKHEKQQLIQSALDSFHRAQQTDPNDHLAEYYLGLQYAYNGQLTEAVAHVKLALNLNAEHVPSLQLLVLLLSAHKQTAEALQLLDAVIQEYPDNMNLHYTKAQLELQHLGGEQALHTAGNMLSLWKNLYEEQIQLDVTEQSDRRSETRSVFQMYSSELSDKDSSSLHAQSLAASRVEHALSEVASSLSSFTPRPGPQKAWLLQVQIWLLLAEIYLSVDNIPEAMECIQEAQNIFPMSHNIMCMRGLLHERKKEFSEAKLCFQNAIAINPTHTKSLQHLGLVYHYLGNQRLAEKTLRDAARIDPSSYQTWYNLGCVLESMNEFDSASDSMATALEVETTNPILPYSSIPLTFE